MIRLPETSKQEKILIAIDVLVGLKVRLSKNSHKAPVFIARVYEHPETCRPDSEAISVVGYKRRDQR